jgi:alpha-ketoglutarate-dependent taurine dioxygenase
VHSDPADDTVKSLRGNEGWHQDSTYMPVQAKGAVFSAEIVPTEGAATGWADMRAAYEALDDETRSLIADLSAYHSLYYSQGRDGYLPSKREDGTYRGYGYHDEEPSLRPLVKVHPDTGRPNLVIGRHAHGIVGMDPEESERLLDRLNREACQPPRVHHHQWAVGDTVVWDNRRLMHRATPFDMTQPRRMWHTRIAGDRASELAANLAAVAPG